MMTKDLTNHFIGQHQSYERQQADTGCFGSFIGGILAIVLCCIITMCTSSCTRTEYITKEVPVVLHDTLLQTVVRYDSIHHRDSIYVETYTKGDTVFRNKYIELWRTRIEVKHDTVRVNVEVPVETTTEIIKEVPAKLTKRQLLLIALGKWMIAAIVLFVLYIVAYIYGKSKLIK